MRWLLRSPVAIYRLRLGALLGNRFLLLTHRGRRSGRCYQTVLEVVQFDARSGEAVVMSGFGKRSNWFQNLSAGGAVAVDLKRHHFIPEVRFLDSAEASHILANYERRNRLIAPVIKHVLGSLAGFDYDGTNTSRRRLVETLPLVGLRPR